MFSLQSGEGLMPRISIFFGIVIYMYYDEHAPPHFHAMYEGSEAALDFNGILLKGTMAPRAARLIKEWAGMHKEELEENWERAERNMPLNWIEPLR
jgi:hypothetical protein